MHEIHIPVGPDPIAVRIWYVITGNCIKRKYFFVLMVVMSPPRDVPLQFPYNKSWFLFKGLRQATVSGPEAILCQ